MEVRINKKGGIMRVRRIFIILCISIFAFPFALVAQGYYIDWADTIDIGDYDCAHGVAVDNANNIIVTGNCGTTGVNYDYLTVKYDSNGTILWQDAIDNGVADIARSVAVDNANNIIVTGQCIITGDPYCHYLTVKYDPNGTILWADTIVNGRHDTGLGVAVDNSNNIIVTGYCVMAGPNCDYFTVKYDSNGTILWQDIIDNRTFDYAHGVAVDNLNNIIVTGTTGEPFMDYDYFTVKYDANGTILWTDILNEGNVAFGVAIDNANNIIVTGFCAMSSNADYFTVKYDPNGTILWQDTLDNDDHDWAKGVTVDNSNNIIVTGESKIGGDCDYFTVKYDSNGTILWQDTIDNGDGDWAHGVAVDNSNNIIVTGVSVIGGDNDYFTVKYVPTSGISNDVDSDLIYGLTLYNIYPNPFRDKTQIKFQIPSTKSQTNSNFQTSLKIYNAAGRLVKSFSLPTTYSLLPTVISWDGRNNAGEKVTSGVYFLRFNAGDYKETRQLLLIK